MLGQAVPKMLPKGATAILFFMSHKKERDHENPFFKNMCGIVQSKGCNG
jgi:hypothetical protein